jgi:hypothetical protein
VKIAIDDNNDRDSRRTAEDGHPGNSSTHLEKVANAARNLISKRIFHEAME